MIEHHQCVETIFVRSVVRLSLQYGEQENTDFDMLINETAARAIYPERHKLYNIMAWCYFLPPVPITLAQG